MENSAEQGDGEGKARDGEADPVELSEIVGESEGAPPGGGSGTPEPTLEEKLAAKERELADLRDRYLRLAADFDNFRKRSAKERAEQQKFALEHLSRQLLEGIDNLERARSHADASDKDTLLEGVHLVENMILQTLEKFGIRRFSALGQPFDPAYHEAIQEVSTTDAPAGAIVFEIQKGYTYHDRLLRPARVVLSKGPPPGEDGAGDAASEASGGDSERGGEGKNEG
jgi:molecular chaperone GrpE